MTPGALRGSAQGFERPDALRPCLRVRIIARRYVPIREIPLPRKRRSKIGELGGSTDWSVSLIGYCYARNGAEGPRSTLAVVITQTFNHKNVCYAR